MKTDKNNISRLKGLAKIVCLTILLAACQNEDVYTPPGEPVQIKLDMTASGTASNRGPEEESADGLISSVRILQFYADGESYGKLAYVATGKPVSMSPGKYTATLRKSMTDTDKYKLVILANPPSGIPFFSLIGKSYAEVQQGCLGTPPLTFSTSNPIPMFGVVNGGKSMQILETSDYGSVELVRAVARLDIGVGTKTADGKWDNAGVPFKLAEILVLYANAKIACIPELERYTVSDDGKINILAPSASSSDTRTMLTTYGSTYITGEHYCSGIICLPETQVWPENGNGAVYDSGHQTRMNIIVGGYYNGSSAVTYYRMDFINATGEGQNILRNKVYRFNITRVSEVGYDTPGEAKAAFPRDLIFDASIDPWTTGVFAKLPVQDSYLMYFGAQNGTIIKASSLYDKYPEFKEAPDLQKKTPFWTGLGTNPPNNEFTVDYNDFYGEVPGNQRRSVAQPNGDIYPDVATLFRVEGVYPTLMVSIDDLPTGNTAEPLKTKWKNGGQLTAFDLCRQYTGLGYTDWRLPRASELMLMLYNRDALERQRGFTHFFYIYWSGSEKSAGALDAIATEAWAVDFKLNPPFRSASPLIGGLKMDTLDGLGHVIETAPAYKIRCVRQVFAFDY